MSECKNRLTVGLFGLFVFVCVASFLIPAFIIRPFRYQSAKALSLAMTVRTTAPAVAAAGFIALILVVMRLWRNSSTLARAGFAVALLLSAACAVMTRLNYFEWMFNPIHSAGFVSASAAHLPDQEMVMSVKIGREARAYPIRQMAYHHVLNDTVARTPIVVTY